MEILPILEELELSGSHPDTCTSSESPVWVTGQTYLHLFCPLFVIFRENLGKVNSNLWCNQQSFSFLGFRTGKIGGF